jgi:glycosyltransferase involved in cell wall biosynthesis
MRVIGTTLLNAFSGEDDGIFDGLRVRGLLRTAVNGVLPPPWASVLLVKSFRPNKSTWYRSWQHEMLKTPLAFHLRTRSLDRHLRSRLGEFDIVLQAGALFAPFDGRYPRPVALFCDYTTKLAELNYPPWFNMAPKAASKWYALETALYQNCAMLFTASEKARSSLIDHYGVDPTRARVVSLGTHSVHDHPEKRYDESTIIFVGIDFERKGGRTLLSAFAKVREHFPEATLLIIGPPSQPAHGGVRWLGHISDRNRIHQLISQATVLTLPSICEPFGFALIEGMAHGLPVVGSSVDAMPEIIREGETGYLVRPGDASALADRLMRLLSSPGLCARMGSAGKDRVRANFLWEHVVDGVEAGLREVCGQEMGVL